MNDSNFYNFLGAELRIYRKLHKLTQEELGNIVGVNKTAIVNYENGSRKIPVHTLWKIAQYFNLSIDQLLSNDASFTSGLKKYQEEIGFGIVTDKEADQVILYTKFLISQRNEKEHGKSIDKE